LKFVVLEFIWILVFGVWNLIMIVPLQLLYKTNIGNR